MTTRDEVCMMVEDGNYDDEYSEYIMDNCGGDRLICNGDMLIEAIEDGYLFEEFVDYKYGQLCEAMFRAGDR